MAAQLATTWIAARIAAKITLEIAAEPDNGPADWAVRKESRLFFSRDYLREAVRFNVGRKCSKREGKTWLLDDVWAKTEWNTVEKSFQICSCYTFAGRRRNNRCQQMLGENVEE